MKFIKSSFEILNQESGLQGIYKQIERAGRTCYKSENLITEDSSKSFVDRMIKLGHGAMLEHGTVYLRIPLSEDSKKPQSYSANHYKNECKNSIIINKYIHNKYSILRYEYPYFYITTNYRVLIQGAFKTWEAAQQDGFTNNWLADLQYICEPTKYHVKRVSVRFICDRGISHKQFVA